MILMMTMFLVKFMSNPFYWLWVPALLAFILIVYAARKIEWPTEKKIWDHSKEKEQADKFVANDGKKWVSENKYYIWNVRKGLFEKFTRTDGKDTQSGWDIYSNVEKQSKQWAKNSK